MPNNSLSALIPIHLDGLYLAQDTNVAGPMVDFSKLRKDKVPYLGEELTAKPLDDSHTLQKGVHLHWALPDALTKTMSLPLVQRHTFHNVFGYTPGNAIWSNLTKANWLTEIIPSKLAKVAVKPEGRRTPPAGIAPEQLEAVNALLDSPGFPTVPNRWLVSRYAADGKTIEKTWVVESDYMWPGNVDGEDNSQPARKLVDYYTSYPQHTKAGATGALQYGFLGRYYEAGTTPPPATPDDYLPTPLTAVGYGEPSFAAFYPNCRSVFGFYDAEMQAMSAARTYGLLGFFSDPGLDYYALFRKDCLDKNPTPYPNIQLLEAIKEEFQWFFPIAVQQSDVGADNWKLMAANGWLTLDTPTATSGTLSTVPLMLGNTLGPAHEAAEKAIRTKLDSLIDQQLPTQTLYYARGTVGPKPNTLPDTSKVSLAIGNTGTEAMSAFLAEKMATKEKALVEDYLEALQLESSLQQQQQDLGPKFEEARHAKGFQAVPGGTIWVVRPQNPDIKKADATKVAEEVTLPDNLADELNELNILQQQLDQAYFQIGSLRQQIFADWCYYISKKHDFENSAPDDGGAYSNQSYGGYGGQDGGGYSNQSYGGYGSQDGGQYESQDNAGPKDTTQEDLDNIQKFIEWEIDTELQTLQDKAKSLGQQLGQQHQQLAASVKGLGASKNYVLQAISAPRYWQPTEPGLLITGIQPSPRYGQDGRLRDDGLLASHATGLAMVPADIANAKNKAAEVAKEVPEDFGFEPQSGHWHPLFMDWAISFRQAHNKFSGNPDEEQYLNSYLQDNFQLKDVDFGEVAGAAPPDKAIPFSGRSVLTPSGSLLPKNTVIMRLVPAIVEAVKKALHTQTLSIEQFITWASTLNPEDKALVSQTKNIVYPRINDEQQISNWISARLADTTDRQLPGIAAWYWKQTAAAVKADAIITTAPQAPTPDGDTGLLAAWAKEHTQLKTTYYNTAKTDETQQSDFFRQNDPQFIPWLKKETGSDALAAFFKDIKLPPGTTQDQFLTENFNQLINWYQAQVRRILHRVLDYQAYQNLCLEHGLSQSLGGFNQALLALSQSYQLNVAVPHSNTKAFAAKVRAAVQTENRYSPVQDGDFSPIRAGVMTFDRINLINTFGQFWPDTANNLTKAANLVRTEAMASTADAKAVKLRPRFAQPARLNFRWLSAHADPQAKDLVEMNSHPATSPVCGWLLPNNLDNSLMVYQQDGQALGYIDEAGQWHVFPGQEAPLQPENISNLHLRKMVQRLIQAGSIPDFISVLDTALDNIQADNNGQHDGLALLMGRPIALVRASISLEHRGKDPVCQNNRIFRTDLGRFADARKAGNGAVAAGSFQRNSFKVDQVNIPLRLGEYRQLNDGLIGYWVDAAPAEALPQGAKADTFFAPQSFDPQKGKPSGNIMTHDENDGVFLFNLTIGQAQPLEVSMLLDPKGSVHANCGVLPVKNINIPPDQYQQALSKIEIAFLTTPILTLPGRLHASLPNEPGYGWSWVEKDKNEWKIIGTQGIIRKVDLKKLPDQAVDIDKLWKELSDNGWIKPTGGDSAQVLPTDERSSASLSEAFQPYRSAIEGLLERSHISPFDATAAFSGTPEIREGWLKLSKTT